MSHGEGLTALSRAEAASLLGWWLDAGVDVGIAEEPRNWLAMKPLPLAGGEEARSAEGEGLSPSRSEQALPRPLPQAGGETFDSPASERENPPATLDSYHAWLAESADLPLFRAGAARALPHGPEHAEIMLLTGMPTPEDAAEGRPIGGAALSLTHRMLAAIGFTPDQAYMTASTCFAAAGTRLSERETEACREQLLHQIDLVRPKRLLLLGDAPARLLLRLGLTQARGKVHRIHHIPAVVTFPPRHLLERGGDKGLAWRDLLLLMGEPL